LALQTGYLLWLWVEIFPYRDYRWC